MPSNKIIWHLADWAKDISEYKISDYAAEYPKTIRKTASDLLDIVTSERSAHYVSTSHANPKIASIFKLSKLNHPGGSNENPIARHPKK